MELCSEYKITIPENSPVYGLFQELKTAHNVSEAEFDRHGYHVVNYAGAGEDLLLKGNGDCSIEPEAVAEFVLDNWKKYQPVWVKEFGYPIPWAFDDAIKEKTKAAIGSIKDILSKEGLKEGSDDYIKKISAALVCYVGVPSPQVFNRLSRERQEEILKQISVLDDLELLKYKDFLLKNGGLGYFLFRNELPFNPTAVKALELGYKQPVVLYAVLELAGLKPLFVETPPPPPVCSSEKLFMELQVAPIRVGVKMSNSALIFGELNLNEDLFHVGNEYYPLHLRHFMQFHMLSNETVSPRANFLGLDVAPNSVLMMISQRERFTGNLSGEKEFLETMVRRSPQISNLRFLLARNALDARRYGEIRPHMESAVKNAGLSDAELGILYLFVGISYIYEDKAGVGIENLLKSLPLNPSISPFTNTILAEGYLKTGDYENAERHAKLALKLAPYSSEAYIRLGVSYIAQKRFKEAEEALKEALSDSPGMASFYLALLYYHRGEVEKMQTALGEFGKVWQRHLYNLNASGKKTTVIRALEEFYKMIKGNEIPLPDGFREKIVKDKISRTGVLLRLFAWMLYSGEETEKALKVIKDALGWDSEDPDLYRALSDIYEGMGEIDKAQEAWNNYLKHKKTGK